MPYRLHPSGYCVAFNEASNENLVPGKSCIFCGRVAGHAHDCPELGCFPFSGVTDHMASGKSSRGALFNATSVLWTRSRVKSFITFTLPSLTGGYYQHSPFCESTGDIAITAKFSKVMEAYALKHKRSTGEKISYVWVSEAQMKRQEKFGGCGDIHFHLVVNQQYKEDQPYEVVGNSSRYNFIDADACDELMWLQSLWCKHLGVESSNCVHVDPIPDGINSIPSYLSKYLGKGSMRKILSRRFSATRDLTKLKPITLVDRPAVGLINTQTKVFDGYTVITEYYSTYETLSHYGNLMEDESRYVGGAKGRACDLNDEQSKIRSENKASREFWDKAVVALVGPESQSAEIRPLKQDVTLAKVTKVKSKVNKRSQQTGWFCTKG